MLDIGLGKGRHTGDGTIETPRTIDFFIYKLISASNYVA